MVLNPIALEVDVLQRVTVRLLAEDAVKQFNFHLESEHYLESSRFAGQSLRCVAEVEGQWIALLTFSAPALQIKASEYWIGWSPRQRARRLGLVVNNSRFLVLPERQRYPNLASRVLDFFGPGDVQEALYPYRNGLARGKVLGKCRISRTAPSVSSTSTMSNRILTSGFFRSRK